MRLRCVAVWLALALAPIAAAKDNYPVVLTKLDGRPGKTLMKAAYNRGGQLGAFYMVSLDTGEVSWTLQSDEIIDVIPLPTGDGWLDIPARKGSGTGRWLSGDTGEILTEVGNGSTMPMVGDWDGNGRLEIFWVKNWYEVSLAD